MSLDIKNELNKVRTYYEGDPLQKRFSALVTGNTGSGKTYLVRTCRKPIHIDSFDPGGTKCLRNMIDSGDVMADTRWENEDPLDPKQFANWKRATEARIQGGYFKSFGTYVLDSATTFGDAIMNDVLKAAGMVGKLPRWSNDYGPQKLEMSIYIKKLMSLPCDFILTGHLKAMEDEVTKTIEYRLMCTGNAVITLPMLFDELYVLQTKNTASGLQRYLLTDAQGRYQARSRLKGANKLAAEEPADIKSLLKKIGLSWEDKPRLEF